MIRRFTNKKLQQLFEKGTLEAIPKEVRARWLRRLGVLHAASSPWQMDIPGFKFRQLDGFDPAQYAFHVVGPWWVTFSFEGANAIDVDLAQSQ